MDQQREINEAMIAIDNSIALFEKTHQALKTAGRLGIWDLLGGGFFSGIMKHSKISEAKELLEEAKLSLAQVKDELDDIENFEGLGIDIGDFLGFADYFFDNFIADWMVQSKISEARSQVFDAIQCLKEIKQKLEAL